MTKSIQLSVVAVVVICLSSFSFQSYAQDAGGLEEIVVTAQKRSE